MAPAVNVLRTETRLRQPMKPPTTTPAAERKRLLVVDDHPMMLVAFERLLNGQPDLEVCCEACDAAAALEMLKRRQPDLLVTDIDKPDGHGINFIQDVLALRPRLPVLVFSMHDEQIYAERVLQAGALGYLMKTASPDEVLAAIRRVLSGRVYVSEKMSARILSAFSTRTPRGSHSPIKNLSDREFEIFQLIGEGLGTREIATQLRLSPKTVEVHRGHLKEKLLLTGAASLARFAIQWVETRKHGIEPDRSGTQ
jgi:DNA-binding NarL/FixJ family response regulator